MKNIHITRMGDPLAPNGAKYYVVDKEGVEQLFVDLELAKLRKKGILSTIADLQKLKERIHREQLDYFDQISMDGIPEKLKLLFEIKKKADVKKYCNNLTISEIELFLLIHNCYQINMLHRSKFPKYLPSHLNITKEDEEGIINGQVGPFSKKLNTIFKERRHIHVHMFQRESEWHCFYYSYKDLEDNSKSHWINGCHIHYVSYLWPIHSRENIWKSFDIRSTKISGDYHIQFITYEEAEEKNIVSSIYPTPTPTAHVLTRGCWIADIKLHSDY